MELNEVKKLRHVFMINENTNKIAVIELLLQRIKGICNEDGLTYEIYRTTSAEDGQEHVVTLAKSGIPLRVYICGGDGTISNIINAAYSYKNISFAVIPLGTGNDFIRSFGSKEDFAQIRKMIYGDSVNIDLIKAGDRICVNMLNIGFDEKVVKYVQDKRHYHIMRNSFAYTFAAFVQLMKMPTEHIKMTMEDGSVIDRRFLLTMIANGKYCGGGYCGASNAKLDDGLMDIVMVRPIHRLSFIKMLSSYRKGTLLNSPRGKKLTIQKQSSKVVLESNHEFEVCCDGDIITTNQMVCEILPSAIKLVLPVSDSIL
jgi:YegS/Rv2252/BmrU family lipid kinase